MASARERSALPLWPTVREAFKSLLENWLAVLRIFWAWSAILVGCVVLAFREMYSFASMLLLMMVGLLAFASTAVAWHRLILLGEQPPAIYLRVGGQVPRYLGRFLLIGLIAAPILFVCSLILILLLWGFGSWVPGPIMPPSAGLLLAIQLLGLFITLPMVFVVSRLSISLPGVALDRPMAFGEAWRLTSSSALRVFGGTLLVYLPSYAINMAFQLSVDPQAGSISLSLVQLLVGVVANFVSTVAAVSFLSLSYRFFAGAPQPVQPQSA